MAQRTLPTFFNFNRSISPSEGFLFGVNTKDDKKHVDIPVEVMERGIRTSISNYTNVYGKNAEDTNKKINVLKDPEKANGQRIDIAFLSQDADRLKMAFSIIVEAASLAPSSCNDVEFREDMVKFSTRYRELGGYDFIAKRYAWNIINGRVLWRNRFVTELNVKVSKGGETIEFNPSNVSLFTFEEETMPVGFDKLANWIAVALQTPGEALMLTVEISGKSSIGSEVFPSQEWLPKERKKEDKSRVLSSVERRVDGRDIRHATMHSQKIGNALRQIDEWHGKVDEYGATAIEAYGYVQSRSEALRIPSGSAKDVYKLLVDITNINSGLAKATKLSDVDDQVHYLMAMLIRGGVFSGASTK